MMHLLQLFMITINQIIFHTCKYTFYKYLINSRHISINNMSYNDLYEKCLLNSTSSSDVGTISPPNSLHVSTDSSTQHMVSPISTNSSSGTSEIKETRINHNIVSDNSSNEIQQEKQSNSILELSNDSIKTETILNEPDTSSLHEKTTQEKLFGNIDLNASIARENINTYISNTMMMDSQKQTYSLADMSYNTHRFYNNFKVFENVTEGCKLWIDEDKNTIQIDNGFNILGLGVPSILPSSISPYQSTMRYFSGQNRVKTHDYLRKEFEEYMKFLTFLLAAMETNDSQVEGYRNFALQNKENINVITIGLYNLRKTYESDEKMRALIDSIITTFADYRNKVDINMKKTNITMTTENIHTRQRSGSN